MKKCRRLKTTFSAVAGKRVKRCASWGAVGGLSVRGKEVRVCETYQTGPSGEKRCKKFRAPTTTEVEVMRNRKRRSGRVPGRRSR